MEPGIYFGMPDTDYHADKALGSSSMKSLATSPPDYWFTSGHNPVRLEKADTEAQILGRAYHKIVLEGQAELGKTFAAKTENWTTVAGRTQKEKFERLGLIGIKPDDWQRLHIAAEVIKANPHLSNAFTGGPTEVSIFWEAGCVPKKARIDCLKMRSSTDLKTIAPRDGMEFPEACIRAMAGFHYAVQAEHYNEGRSYLEAFINDGMVYGDHDADFLAKVAAEKEWASVFIFLKKTGAPLTFGTMISQKNPLLEIARGTLIKATENYVRFSKEFGFDRPWLTNDPLVELALEDFPAYWRSL